MNGQDALEDEERRERIRDAAEDMLAALKTLVAAWTTDVAAWAAGENDSDDALDCFAAINREEIWKSARAAIAKATGGTP